MGGSHVVRRMIKADSQGSKSGSAKLLLMLKLLVVAA